MTGASAALVALLVVAGPDCRAAAAASDEALEALDRRIDEAFHHGTRRELRRLLFKSVDLDPRPREVRTLAWALSMAVSDEDSRPGASAFVFADRDFADLGGLKDPVLAAIARAKAGGREKARAVFEWGLRYGGADYKRYEDYGDALSLEEGYRLRVQGREAEAIPLLKEAAFLYDKAIGMLSRDSALDAMRGRLLIKQANLRLTLSRTDRANAASHRALAVAGYREALLVARPKERATVDMDGALWPAADVWGKAVEQARRHLNELGEGDLR